MSLTGFTKPSLTDLQERIRADIQAKLPDIDSRLTHTVMSVVADTFTGVIYSLYGYLDYIADQTNVLYANGDNLDKFGEIWSILRRPATLAIGSASITGTEGTVIPAGTVMQTQNNLEYVVLSTETISVGVAMVSLESKETGSAQNQAAGTTVSLYSPIVGIDPDGTTGAILGGTDTELDELYRARILERINQAPHGGTVADYITWTKEVADVTRAWCYPLENGPGTVTIRFMTDDATGDGVPSAGTVSAAQTYINTLKPVTATVAVIAPVVKPLNIVINGLNPGTSAVRTAVEAELTDMLRRRASPGQTIHLSWIYEAISAAAGESNHSVVFPTGDVSQQTSEIATLGLVTYA